MEAVPCRLNPNREAGWFGDHVAGRDRKAIDERHERVRQLASGTGVSGSGHRSSESTAKVVVVATFSCTNDRCAPMHPAVELRKHIVDVAD